MKLRGSPLRPATDAQSSYFVHSSKNLSTPAATAVSVSAAKDSVSRVESCFPSLSSTTKSGMPSRTGFPYFSITAALRCLLLRVLASTKTKTNLPRSRSRTLGTTVSARCSRRHQGHQFAPKSSRMRLSSRVARTVALSINASAFALESKILGPIEAYSGAVRIGTAREINATRMVAEFIASPPRVRARNIRASSRRRAPG